MPEFRVDGKPYSGTSRMLLALAYHQGQRVEWSGTYQEYLQTPLWRRWRERIIERDGHRCRLCDNFENLTVHHSSYAYLGAERDQDVVTLCESCHYDFHKWRKRPKLLSTVLSEALPVADAK